MPPDGLEIAPLDGDTVPFQSLTYPRFAARLGSLPKGFVALAARLNGRPAGIVILNAQSPDGFCRLISVMVARPFRRYGIGMALIQAAEAVARQHDRAKLATRLTTRMRDFPAAKALFQRAGFSEPQLYLVNLTGEVGPMSSCVFTHEWRALLRRTLKSRTYDFEPWSAFSPSEEADFAALKQQSAYHNGFRFDHLGDRIDPVCSLKIHRFGRLIGWIVAEPLEGALASEYPDRVCRHYVSAYLDETLWHTGVLLAGYYHAFSRQATAYGERSIANYFSEMPRQVELSRRRFAPMALHWDEIYTLEKSIAPADVAPAAYLADRLISPIEVTVGEAALG